MVSEPALAIVARRVRRTTIANAGDATAGPTWSRYIASTQSGPEEHRLIGGNVTSRITAVIRLVGTAALAASSAVNIGCYRYSPVEAHPSTMVGVEMRVRLTDAGAVAL